MKYCKHCGSPINSHTMKCDNCGKQYFTFRNKWVILSFVFILLFLVASTANFFLYRAYVSASDNSTSLKEKYDSSRAELSSLQSKNSELSARNKELRSENSAKSDELSYLRDKTQENDRRIRSLEKYLYFYHSFDHTYYHRYGCTVSGTCYFVTSGMDTVFDDVVFCSREYAISRGYIACPDCVR